MFVLKHLVQQNMGIINSKGKKNCKLSAVIVVISLCSMPMLPPCSLYAVYQLVVLVVLFGLESGDGDLAASNSYNKYLFSGIVYFHNNQTC